jgi:hypothetical protein
MSSNTVENNPEFYKEVKEVVEKDYEILELANGEYTCDGTNIGAWLRGSRGNWVISKIKRLSDGVVFSIGDKVEWNWADSDDKFYTIKGFELGNKYNEGKIAVDLLYSNGSTYLFQNLVTDSTCNFRHYKEPLYVTADGFEVKEFGKDRLYWVYQKDDESNGKYYIGNTMSLSKYHLPFEPTSKRHLFYSEEKAKAFVAKKNEEALLDSKVLSYNDVYSLIGDTYRLEYNPKELERKLKELVRSKQ